MDGPSSLLSRREGVISATVMMPGTCGELVQGVIEGVTFHISCPIDIYSTVSVELADNVLEWHFPIDTPKAVTAVKAALERFDASSFGGRLSIASHLPRAKGMGSSTADVAGAISALAFALGHEISEAEIAAMALQIEPSDGSIFHDIVLFDHREGRIYERLGPAPPIDIVVLDFGGEVDTILFNQQDWSAVRSRSEPAIIEAAELARRGLRTGDLESIGRAATISALANQAILYKPQLEQVLRLAGAVHALGVNVGHSGTVIGVLLDRRFHDAFDIAAFLSSRLAGLEWLKVCHLIGGGCKRVDNHAETI